MAERYGVGAYYPTHWIGSGESNKTVEAICAASYSNANTNGQIVTVYRYEDGSWFVVDWMVFNRGNNYTRMKPSESLAWLRLHGGKP